MNKTADALPYFQSYTECHWTLLKAPGEYFCRQQQNHQVSLAVVPCSGCFSNATHSFPLSLGRYSPVWSSVITKQSVILSDINIDHFIINKWHFTPVFLSSMSLRISLRTPGTEVPHRACPGHLRSDTFVLDLVWILFKTTKICSAVLQTHWIDRHTGQVSCHVGCTLMLKCSHESSFKLKPLLTQHHVCPKRGVRKEVSS